MDRQRMVRRVFTEAEADVEPWDMLIVGGGATGVGIAVDAASRGYQVLLVEQSDFGKATSSRSTKLIHGGVRYLRQGKIGLVLEALRERAILLRNAPHLVHGLKFVVPTYRWWERAYYGLGMKVYDLLAGGHRLGRSQLLSRQQVLEHVPTLSREGLRGGVLYYDGQFDDARLLINLVQTAAEQGATLINYCACVGLSKDSEGMVDGAVLRDVETGHEQRVAARCVINATGAFTETVVKMAEAEVPAMIAPSQGAHVVLDGSFLPGDSAVMVPRTSDGRILFAIPWLGHTLLGTTDTPIERASLEPRPLEREIAFILETAGVYLAKRPGRADVRSVFAGIRPLARRRAATKGGTAKLSREHIIDVSRSGLISIFGGKWTTFRKMADDCVERAVAVTNLPKQPCRTQTLRIHGWQEPGQGETADELATYGSDAAAIEALMRSEPALADRLHEALPLVGAQVVHAVRSEMARTVDDVLARRTRCLHLDAAAATEAAPAVAELMARELGRDEAWQREQVEGFVRLAEGYRVR